VSLAKSVRRAGVIGVALALSSITLVGIAHPAHAGSRVRLVSNVKYYTDPGDRLDEYLPTSTAPTPKPAVIFIHGGAWDSGDKSRWSAYASSLVFWTGWDAFNIDFDMKSSTPFATEPTDVFAAIKWVKKHAKKLNVDRSRIAVVGASSGGHLALLAGMKGSGPSAKGSRVRAVVSWSGLSDLPLVTQDAGCYDTECDYNSNAQWIGSVTQHFEGNTTAPATPERWTKSSPITQVDKTDARTLLINSTDERVNLDQTQRMEAALSAHHVPVKTVVYNGTEHGMEYGSRAWPTTLSWLLKNL